MPLDHDEPHLDDDGRCTCDCTRCVDAATGLCICPPCTCPPGS